jgi:uncharacterized protein
VLTVDDLVQLFGFAPLPVEGGLFTQTYRAPESVSAAALPERYQHAKPLGTAIMFLYTPDPDSFSALHRLPTDELYHFYMGDPVELVQLYPDGRSERVVLGHDLLNGQRVQYCAPRGVWMGSYMLPGGSYALIGTTMAPGFTEDDYEGGEREALIAAYPEAASLIERLTRPGDPLRMPPET